MRLSIEVMKYQVYDTWWFLTPTYWYSNLQHCAPEQDMDWSLPIEGSMGLPKCPLATRAAGGWGRDSMVFIPVFHIEQTWNKNTEMKTVFACGQNYFNSISMFLFWSYLCECTFSQCTLTFRHLGLDYTWCIRQHLPLLFCSMSFCGTENVKENEIQSVLPCQE